VITHEYIELIWVWKFELEDRVWDIDFNKLPSLDDWTRLRAFINKYLYPYRIKDGKRNKMIWCYDFWEIFFSEIMRMKVTRIGGFYPSYPCKESNLWSHIMKGTYYSTWNKMTNFPKWEHIYRCLYI
jgi:hypothetical protein